MGFFSKTGKANEKSTQIQVEVTPINGMFSLEDFKEFSKMKLSSSEEIQELVLIGSKLLLDKENSLTKMLQKAITFKVNNEFTTSYVITVKNNDVSVIDVIISNDVDEAMANMLDKNNQIVRVCREHK